MNKLFKLIFDKLFKINDSPHKIALGVGIGVFFGFFPGTGPIAALFLALIFKANRAAALIGSALTNTWLSFLTFFMALKIGCVIMKVTKLSFAKAILPLAIGYVVIGLILGLLSYLLTLLILRRIKPWKLKMSQKMSQKT